MSDDVIEDPEPMFRVCWIEPLTEDRHELTRKLTFGFAMLAAADFIRTGTPRDQIVIVHAETGEITSILRTTVDGSLDRNGR